MAVRSCSTPRCPNLIPQTHGKRVGRCDTCRATADKQRRPTGNPYASAAHQRFREHVLAVDPVCVQCLNARATIADHHPLERTELIEAGLDPNDPQHGRGLCKPCHDAHTAATHGLGGAH